MPVHHTKERNMPKKQSDKPQRRTQVKELPREQKDLTKDEQKDVKGGARGLAIGSGRVGGNLVDPDSTPS
jgi:hypothetical protein